MLTIINLLNYGNIPGTFYCTLNGQTYSSSNFVIHRQDGVVTDIAVTFTVAPDTGSGTFEVIKAVIDDNGVTVTSFSF